MPYLRHKAWFEDGLPAHTVTLGLAQHTFWDKDQGIAFIPHRETTRQLLNRYPELEIAWEKYGVRFASDGTEVVPEPEEPPSTSEPAPEDGAKRPAPKKRGRPPGR